MVPFVLQAFFFSFFMAGLSVFLTTVRKKEAKNNLKKILQKPLPGPISFPLIGGLLQIMLLGEREHNYEAYHKACQKYGKVMGFRGGVQNYLITEDKDAIKEILTSSDWTSRFPSTKLYQHHTFNNNFGLIFSNGDSWKTTRRFATKTLGEHGFGELRTLDRILDGEVEAFIQQLEKLRKNKDEISVNGLFSIPSLNVSWALVAGTRFDYEDHELHNLLHLVDRASECEFGLHPVFAFPWLNWIPGLSPLNKFKRAFDAIYHQLKILLLMRRNGKEGEKNTDQTKTSNLIDSFLFKIENEKSVPNNSFTDEQLLVTVADLLVASIDTTSNSLSFAVLFMIKYPEVQRRVQTEIEQVLGDKRPSVFDRSKLPYTEATMWEVLRIANVLPIFVRTATCDTTVQGYAVKEGVFGVLNVYKMHMDPNIWGDPHQFRPERFLNADGSVKKDNGVFAFGGGRRVCVGQTVAKLTFFTIFSSIFQRYNFEMIHHVTMVPISGFTNSPQPFSVRISPR